MKITCGTDIIEISRIKKIIDDDDKDFLNRIFTEEEIKYCESKKQAKYQHYAVRFSAKEAIFKAISNNLENKFDISWKDAEILNDKNGRPSINFIDTKIDKLENIEISMSHCKEYAVANVVAVWKD